MKSFFVIATCVALISAASFAGEFKTQLFDSTKPLQIHVLDNEFMLIRNFTQGTPGTGRGSVKFTRHNDSAIVLTAAIQDSTNVMQGSEEVINSVILAGPAIVRFDCGTDASCVATFKIDSN